MDAKSQQKIIAAGFSIIRCDDHPSPRIKVKDRNHQEWSTYQKYDTKTERDRCFKMLLDTSDMVIND